VEKESLASRENERNQLAADLRRKAQIENIFTAEARRRGENQQKVF
jgi:hypothetical protein